jgi:hypothetical protein
MTPPKPAASMARNPLCARTLRSSARLALKWKFSIITDAYTRHYNNACDDIARDLRERALLIERESRTIEARSKKRKRK